MFKIVPFMRKVENTVEPGRPQMAIWRMHIACWIPKATNTHSVCVIKGKAIPLQAWTSPEDSRRLRLSDFKTIGT